MGMRYPRAGSAIYRTEQWKAVRLQAKRRDGWKCVQCEAKGRIEVDHIKPIRDGGAPYDLQNLQCLCVQCHSRKTRVEVGLAEMSPARAAWKNLLTGMEKTNA
ncbi:HNH endonuclease [Sphingobium bisphenolivorans]|uniref:HNH endonuclease n=1 Tax=Sphingobium bisphenolivorans TaxID=1335760 RepID=UPI0003B4E02A|nr:HNH endonuclease signature motif containing protein [Sphingobium bisphenolivorans]